MSSIPTLKFCCTSHVSFFNRMLLQGAPLAAVITCNALAQTAPITPSGLNTQVNLSPTPPAGKLQYDITGGTRPGGGPNLFHSFGQFNVPSNNIGNFLNETPNLATSNILARVTDPNPSSIFGTIQTTHFGSANLFLMNPAGIVFGPNATLNVGGSVNFTTANYIRLFDGTNSANFYANPASDAVTAAGRVSILSSAPLVDFGFVTPAAFGFLNSTPAAIAVQGSTLSVPNGQSISLVGGTQGFNYADPDNGFTASVPGGVTIAAGKLSAPSGQTLIASVASPGEVLHQSLDTAPNINNESFTNHGSVSISQGAFLDVSGSPGGTVRIRGGEFVLDSSFVTANTSGDTPGASTAIQVTTEKDVKLANGSALISFSDGAGRAGDIEVNASTVHVLDGSVIFTGSAGSAPAGTIRITASDSVSLAGHDPAGLGLGSSITSDSADNCGCTEPSGNVEIATRVLTLDNQATIQTRAFGDRRAGNVSLNVDDLIVRNGSGIQTFGSEFAPSGSIQIRAGGTILLSGQFDSDTPSRITNINEGTAGTGTIAIQTGSLTLEGGARIRNETLASPEPGQEPKIAIIANENVNLSGGSNIRVLNVASDVGGIELVGQTIALADQSVIRTETFGNGDAGPIHIEGQQLAIMSGSVVESSTFSNAGRGGNIDINLTGDFSLTGHVIGQFGETLASNISSRTTGSGPGGLITISAPNTRITDGAFISASSAGAGPAGSVTIRGPASPAESIMIDGTGSGILTEASGTGAGGNITTGSNQLQLTNSATISSRTTGQMAEAGDAGNILIRADDITISGGGTITAASTGPGNAGTVTIQGTNSPALSLLITGSGSGLFSDTSGTGTGGDITAWANEVQITNDGTISARTTSDGNAGNVLIKSDRVSFTNGGRAESGSVKRAPLFEDEVVPPPTGDGGSVTIKGTASPAQTVMIDGAGSGVFTLAEGTGDGGNVRIETSQSTTVTNGGAVSASSTGKMDNAGDAGSVTIHAGNTFLMQDSSVTTQATKGGGGTIDITAKNLLRLINSTISSSVLDGEGGGGNITIDPDLVLLQNGQILAKAVFGNGGNITITTPLFLADQSSLVSASSQFGLNGTVTIQSPTSNLAGTVASLPSSIRQTPALQTGRCAALANNQASSFVVAGRETMPAEPGGWLPSPFALAGEGAGPVAMAKGVSGSSRLSSSSGLSGEIDQNIYAPLSLRRLTPAGFLTQSFAESGSTGCRS